ncbi:MAG: ATP-binding protein [Lactobacillaceae bacterium]|jgi:predicted AAA+ superfamily ATPase|nr:ATP-binding protein [Lactobacillaceae bacterium]
MIQREHYLKKIRPFIDSGLIKVVTGIRRSGKSMLLAQVQKELLAAGRTADQFIRLNFEQLQYEALTDYHRLNDYLVNEIEKRPGEKVYLFLDEIQEVDQFQKVINSLRVNYEERLDIYVTGSNAKLLSGELATLLGGRYINITVYPFSFAEYKQVQLVADSDEKLFEHYLETGGMPFLTTNQFELVEEVAYLNDVYNSIVLKDIVQRDKIRDADLLQRLLTYIISNIGRTFSARSLVNYLKNEGIATSTTTIMNYLTNSTEAYIILPLKRFDIQGKKVLSTQEKYYVVDHGFREAVTARNARDIELILENIVLVELLKRGYQVSVGKFGDLEVDFVAEKNGANGLERVYIQVSYILATPETRMREFAPLLKIDDNYPKMVLTLDPLTSSEAGIEHVKLQDWLLSDD